MGVFNGLPENIEDNRKKVAVINEDDADDFYPTSRAVQEFVAEEIAIVDKEIREHIDKKVEQEGDNFKEYGNNVFANAIKGNVKASVVSVDDVSPIEHNVSVKVVSENMLPYIPKGTVITQSGITYTDLGDGGVQVQGTATGYALFTLSRTQKAPFEAGKTYTVWLSSDSVKGVYLIVNYKDANGETKYVMTTGKATITWTEEYTLDSVYLQTQPNVVADAIVYPMIYEGTETTTYKPYVPYLSSLVLIQQGKNLLPPVIRQGVSSPQNIYFYPTGGYILLPAGTYTFSVKPKDGEVSNLYVAEADGKFETLKFYGVLSANFTLTETSKIQPYVWKGSYTSEDAILWAQIEAGSAATEYEAYIEPRIYTPNEDGTVEGVTSISPNMTLFIDAVEGLLVDVEYNKDTNKVVEKLTQAILSLGGNV